MSFALPDHATAIVLTFVLAGFVKGAIGLGLPTVSMGLLTIAMTPVQAAALLVVPSFVTNVWQLVTGPRFAALVRRLWPMMVAIALGTWAGAGLLRDDGGRAATWLGIALIAYAAIGLSRLTLSVPRAHEPWLAPIVGLVTGWITAATGVFVIPAVPFLGAIGLAKDELVQALGLSFTVSTIALAVVLAEGGALGGATLGASTVALVAALVGMFAGGWVRGRVSEPAFRRCFFVGLLLLGLHLASRAVR